MFVWSKFGSRSCTVECRSSTNFPNSLHCSSLPKAFSCWWGQSQGSIWHHSDSSWRSWGTSWHKSRGHGASVVYARSTSHSHLTHLYLLLSHIREGSLESFLLSSHHFFLLPPHLFLTAPALLLLPELQLLSFLHFLILQLFHPPKFLTPHQILPH